MAYDETQRGRGKLYSDMNTGFDSTIEQSYIQPYSENISNINNEFNNDIASLLERITVLENREIKVENEVLIFNDNRS